MSVPLFFQPYEIPKLDIKIPKQLQSVQDAWKATGYPDKDDLTDTEKIARIPDKVALATYVYIFPWLWLTADTLRCTLAPDHSAQVLDLDMFVIVLMYARHGAVSVVRSQRHLDNGTM